MFQSTFGQLMSRGSAAREASSHARTRAGVLGDAFRRLREQVQQRMIPSAWVHTDGRGIIVAADSAAARLFNVTLQRLVGTPLLHLVARRDTKPFRVMVKLLGYPHAIHEAVVRMRSRHASMIALAVKVTALDRGRYRWSFAAALPPGEPEKGA